MSLTATIDAMVAAGCTPEQLAAVVRVYTASEETRAAVAAATAAAKDAERKAINAERKRLQRSSHVTVTDEDISRHGGTGRDIYETGRDTLSPKKEVSPTPPIEKTTPIQSSLRSEYVSARHAEFYADFPKKVEPKASLAKFIIAVRRGVDPDHIVAAGKRFGDAHRIAGTDKQFIPAPAVWLNRGGYDSEDLPTAPARASPTGMNGSTLNGNHGGVSGALRDIQLREIEKQRDGPLLDLDGGGTGGTPHWMLPKG